MVNNRYKLSNLFVLTRPDGTKEFGFLAKFCRIYELNYSLLHRKIAELGHHSITGVGTFEKAQGKVPSIEEQQFVKLIMQDEDIAVQLVYPNGICILQDKAGAVWKVNFKHPSKNRIHV